MRNVNVMKKSGKIVDKSTQNVLTEQCYKHMIGVSRQIKENRRMLKLKLYRIELGLTQAEMAHKLGITPSYYQKIERGERDTSTKFIRKFSQVFPAADCWRLFFAN